MKVYQLLSFFALLFLSANTKAQLIIDVNKNGYFVNRQKIELPIVPKKLLSALGAKYRTFDGANTIYTYDQLGLRLYKPRDGNVINSLDADFIIGPYSFSQKQIFKGELAINGYKVDSTFNKSNLANIPDLFFDKNGSNENGYRAVTFNDISIYFDFNQQGHLKSIGISFWGNKGEFSSLLQTADPKASVVNIDFKYEKGAVGADGQKIGTWEYYDNPNELSLKYDHNADTIVFLKKNENEFVIYDGASWQRKKLQVYPRAIASDFEFRKTLAKGISYPKEAREESISGTVYISFIIGKDGILQHIKIQKDIGGGCGDAVVNALNSLKVSWTHAAINNVSYDSRFIIPVSFEFGLDETKSTGSTDEKPSLPEASIIPEIKIVAMGTPYPVKNN